MHKNHIISYFFTLIVFNIWNVDCSIHKRDLSISDQFVHGFKRYNGVYNGSCELFKWYNEIDNCCTAKRNDNCYMKHLDKKCYCDVFCHSANDCCRDFKPTFCEKIPDQTTDYYYHRNHYSKSHGGLCSHFEKLNNLNTCCDRANSKLCYMENFSSKCYCDIDCIFRNDCCQDFFQTCLKRKQNSAVQNTRNEFDVPMKCKKYHIVEEVDCNVILIQNSINLEQLKLLNKDFECEKLEKGDKLCVSSEISPNTMGLVPNCTDVYTTKEGDTCESIMNVKRMTHKRFNDLNPFINCKKLKEGRLICLNNGYSGCIKTIELTDLSHTCSEIAESHSIQLKTLKAINPGLNCDKLNMRLICVEATNPDCMRDYKVLDNDNFNSILREHNVSESEFYSANPYLDKSDIVKGKIICLEKKQNENYFNYFLNVFDELSNINSDLSEVVAKYKKDPKSETLDELYTKLDTTVDDPNAREVIKKIEDNDENIQNFYKEMKLDREKMCENSEVGTLANNCFCNSSEPIMYCTKLLHQDLVKKAEELQMEPIHLPRLHHNKTIIKRAIPIFPFCFTHSELFGTKCIKSQCFVTGPIEYCVSLGRYFGKTNSRINVKDVNYIDSEKWGVKLEYCFPFVNSFVKYLGKMFWPEISPCFFDIHADFYVNRGYMEFSANLKLSPIASLSLMGKAQINKPIRQCNSSFPSYCDYSYCYEDHGALTFNVDLNILYFFRPRLVKRITESYNSKQCRKDMRKKLNLSKKSDENIKSSNSSNVTQPQSHETEHTEPQSHETEHTEPQSHETEHTEPQSHETEHTEPQSHETEHTEPESDDTEHTESPPVKPRECTWYDRINPFDRKCVLIGE